MPIKKVKSNGKLPTAKDYKNLKTKLTEADKKRIAITQAVLREMIRQEENEKTIRI